jgi:hypothetical protein
LGGILSMADIKVGRYKKIGYTVNYPMNNGMTRRFEWAGEKNGKIDIKPIPEEVVDYLMMNSVCFKHGELKIIEDTEQAKEIVDNLGDDKEEYLNNTKTKEEIVKLLEGNYKKLESEVKKMNKLEVQYVVDVAKEIKLDSSSKQKILAEALNIDKDILFEEE